MSTARIPGRAPFELSKTAALLVAVVQMLVLAPGDVRAAPIAWKCDYREALEESASRRLPVLVVFGARWCRYCRKMQAETFANPAVTARLADQFIPLYIDADAQGELVEKFKVSALPTVVIISPERMIVDRCSGFQSAAQLEKRLACYKTTVAKPALRQPARSAVESRGPPTTLEAAEAFSRGR